MAKIHVALGLLTIAWLGVSNAMEDIYSHDHSDLPSVMRQTKLDLICYLSFGILILWYCVFAP